MEMRMQSRIQQTEFSSSLITTAIFSRTGWNVVFLHFILNLPATKRIVPISPHIGLVSADAGMSLLTVDHSGDAKMVSDSVFRKQTEVKSLELVLG